QTTGELRPRGHRVDVLFLEASDETLVRRYHESRRRHPLAGEGNVVDGIRAGRKALPHPREAGDPSLASSSLTVHQLKGRLVAMYSILRQRESLTVSLVSFGFKHGIP